MLQNGVGWTTSSSSLGTRHLTPSLGSTPRLPITPPIVPRPTPTPTRASTPPPVAPPISPGELEISVNGLRHALEFAHGGHGVANGGEPFGDPDLIRDRTLRACRMVVGGARHCRAEQQRGADRSDGDDLRHELEVFFTQRHHFPS